MIIDLSCIVLSPVISFFTSLPSSSCTSCCSRDCFGRTSGTRCSTLQKGRTLQGASVGISVQVVQTSLRARQVTFIHSITCIWHVYSLHTTVYYMHIIFMHVTKYTTLNSIIKWCETQSWIIVVCSLRFEGNICDSVTHGQQYVLKQILLCLCTQIKSDSCPSTFRLAADVYLLTFSELAKYSVQAQ